MPTGDSKLTRIGIFYDGNFFAHVSNYYHYNHERRARISVSGLHAFIRDEVGKCEGTDARYCQIVDAHYFRGRLRASEAESRDILFRERVFEDVLVREGVTTHYLPLGPEGEKGIDVWLALEAFELAIYKRFNVSVLVASDGDYLPLIRKLNTLGTRVMVLGWDFKFIDQNGNDRETRTAQVLLDEGTYPVMMHQIIDDRARRNDPLINGLFVPRRDTSFGGPANQTSGGGQPLGSSAPAHANVNSSLTGPLSSSIQTTAVSAQLFLGKIKSIKGGYGYLEPDQGGRDMFFYYLDVLEPDFADLKVGDKVEYSIGKNDKGPCAKEVRRLP
jgi:cold shock CspA family protein